MRMRKITAIMLAVLGLLFAVSCQRRPLTDADYTVNIRFNMDYDIVNFENPAEPELMRVAFFDHTTGRLVTHAFLPPSGGQMSVVPGRIYDVLAYNFDTRVTYINNENDFNSIVATTNSISESFKSKLRSRGTRTPDTSAEEDETIVYDPDHLWVGRLGSVDLPRRSVDSPEITLTIDCATVVQTWKLEVDKIEGSQWIGSISALITGLSRYNSISSGDRSHDYASVFFDIRSIGADGVLNTTFNTFGARPGSGEGAQILSLVITDVAGNGYVFNADVSDQFVDNPAQIIRIKTDGIVIPEPEKKDSGGLAPSVDEWKTIVSEIVI